MGYLKQGRSGCWEPLQGNEDDDKDEEEEDDDYFTFFSLNLGISLCSLVL